jgi:hypothetical protein
MGGHYCAIRRIQPLAGEVCEGALIVRLLCAVQEIAQYQDLDEGGSEGSGGGKMASKMEREFL